MGYTQILRRMTEGGVVLIDGATGTELEKRGADMNDDAWCGPANISHRGMLEEVHQDYIYAGAEIIITNTFATTRLMLEPAGFADRIEQVYRSACAAAIKARERVSGEHGHSDVLVAGSLSHMVPMTSIGSESADPYSGVGREKFCAALHEAAGLLKDGGCDLLMLEMMYHPQRFQCALEAALSTGLPVWAGFSARWGENGEVLSYFPEEDIPLEEVIALLPRKGADAAGIMHSNVDITGPALEILGRYFTGPRYAYPDSGFFRMPHWQFEDIISPADLTAYAVDWIADGVSAVGGCCGLSVEHIEALSTLKHQHEAWAADVYGSAFLLKPYSLRSDTVIYFFTPMALFKTLPENFFRPLASPLKEHYAALLLIFYRLFLEYQGSIERAQVVREFEDYFRSHEVEADFDDDAAETAPPGEAEPKAPPGEGAADETAAARDERSPRDVANYFLRRLTAYGWVGNEILEDFTQLVTMNSWAKPFFEALYSTSTGMTEEYESHIVAVYSLLTGGAARENGHYNLMSAHSHVRRLVESLKVLSQNIRTYLQNLYSEEAEVHEILHIHYDLYMHEVVDRAYNRLKTSDNLSKYRPLINKAVGAFLQDEAWLRANAERLAVVKRTSVEQARKLMVEMLKEIRDSLRGIDPILDEIDDKNRRYSKISTQKIKTKLYSDASLQGKLRDIVTALAKGSLGAGEVPLQLYHSRFLAPGSLYTRPRGSRSVESAAVGVPEDDSDLLFKQREMELKVTGQLNPRKVAEFLRAVRGRPDDAEADMPRGALRSQDIARDMDGFIKLLYAAGYAEAGRADFPFEVVWGQGEVEVQGFHFQDHYYIERRRGGDGA